MIAHVARDMTTDLATERLYSDSQRPLAAFPGGSQLVANLDVSEFDGPRMAVTCGAHR